MKHFCLQLLSYAGVSLSLNVAVLFLIHSFHVLSNLKCSVITLSIKHNQVHYSSAHNYFTARYPCPVLNHQRHTNKNLEILRVRYEYIQVYTVDTSI